MAIRFSKSAATLALGVAFIVTPALLHSTTLLSVESALAAKGGNGNGNSGGNGNGNGSAGGNGNSSAKSEKSSPAKTEKVAKSVEVASTEKKTKNIASKLGALNAAHASPRAFAHASPNSRIGKIKAYYEANQAFLTAQLTAGATDAVALQAAFEASAPASVVDAYEALQANPADPALQAAYDLAVATEVPTAEQLAELASTYTGWQSAVNDDALAAAAEAEAEAALNAAANKTPVSPEARIALDALLVGKIE